MAVCLLGGAKIAVVTADLFTVAWTMQATGVEWQRTYMVAPGAIVTAELRAKTADAEPPLPGGQRDGDSFVWRMSKRAFPMVYFGGEPGTADWKVCWDGSCKPLRALTDTAEGVDITARPCKAEAAPAQ